MRFLIDMPLSPALARWLMSEGHDALHASEAGLAQAADSAILERARSESRIVVTADLDYPRLLALQQASRPGLILFRGGDFSEAETKARLESLLASVPDDIVASSIFVVEHDRVRRRPLPIE